MVRLLSESDLAGRNSGKRTQVFNDLEVLACTPNFFSKFKLHEVKGWHHLNSSIIGLELVFINPHDGEKLAPGSHIGYAWNEATSLTSLVLEFDEYIEEVRGRAEKNVDYLFIRTNRGRYLELGNPQAKGEFKYKIPEGFGVMSFEVGIKDGLEFIGIQTMPIAHMQLMQEAKPSLLQCSSIPSLIIQRSEYFGVLPISPIFRDDFWELGLQPHVKSRGCQLKSITVIFQRMIFGLQITYEVGSQVLTSSYNFDNAVRDNPHADSSSLTLDDQDDIIAISGLSNEQGIQALQIFTSKGRNATWGSLTGGKEFAISTSGRILAFRGVWDRDVVQALMVYFVE
jgi:hypothetical protein